MSYLSRTAKADVAKARRLGVTDEVFQQIVVRATPPRTVEALAQAAAFYLRSRNEGDKAGVCLHPEEVEMDRRLFAWLDAFSRNPEDPEAEPHTNYNFADDWNFVRVSLQHAPGFLLALIIRESLFKGVGIRKKRHSLNLSYYRIIVLSYYI